MCVSVFWMVEVVCVCVCVISCGSEWGVTAFAWFAATHTVHSGTVIFVP